MIPPFLRRLSHIILAALLVGAGEHTQPPIALGDPVSIALDSNWTEAIAALPPEERVDQLLDLQLVAAAKFLCNADQATITRNATLRGAVRLDALSSMEVRAYGAGRSMGLGSDDLLVLVPDSDGSAQRSRILYHLVDEWLTTSEAPPTLVHVVEYDRAANEEFLAGLRDTELPRAAGKALRITHCGNSPGTDYVTDGKHGYVRRTLSSPSELEQFLASIDEVLGITFLSDSKVELAGRRIGGPRCLALGLGDFSVLASIYSTATPAQAERGFSGPGFSLDPHLDVARFNRSIAALAKELGDYPQDHPARAFLRQLEAAAAPIARQDLAPLTPVGCGALLRLEAQLQEPPSESSPTQDDRPTRAHAQWLKRAIRASTVAVARYDGQTANAESGAISQTDFGLTLFYVDVLAKDLLGSGSDPNANTPLPSMQQVVSRLAFTLFAELNREASGRLWWEPSFIGHTIRPDAIRFGHRAVRLLLAESTSPLEVHEVEPPPHWAVARDQINRRYEDLAAADPQLHRFRECCKLMVAFEWARSTGRVAQLSALSGTKVSAEPAKTFDGKWIQHQPSRSLDSIVKFSWLSRPGREVLEAPVPVAFSLGSSDRIFQGVSGATPVHVRSRTIPPGVKWKNLPADVDLTSIANDGYRINGTAVRVDLNDLAQGIGRAFFERPPSPNVRALRGDAVQLRPGLAEELSSTTIRRLNRTVSTHDQLTIDQHIKIGERADEAIATVTFQRQSPSQIQVALHHGEATAAAQAAHSVLHSKHVKDSLVTTGERSFEVTVNGFFRDADGATNTPPGASECIARVSRGQLAWAEVRHIDPSYLAEVKSIEGARPSITGLNAYRAPTLRLAKDDEGRLEFVMEGKPAWKFGASHPEEWEDLGGEFARVEMPKEALEPSAFLELCDNLQRLREVTDAEPLLEWPIKGATARRATLADLSGNIIVHADERAIRDIADGTFARYLRRVQEDGKTAAQYRMLLTEAAASEDAMSRWLLQAKNGDFQGQFLVVGVCADEPGKLQALAVAALENGARGVVLPYRTVNVGAYTFAVHELGSLAPNVAAGVFEGTSGALWRSAHVAAANRIARLEMLAPAGMVAAIRKDFASAPELIDYLLAADGKTVNPARVSALLEDLSQDSSAYIQGYE